MGEAFSNYLLMTRQQDTGDGRDNSKLFMRAIAIEPPQFCRTAGNGVRDDHRTSAYALDRQTAKQPNSNLRHPVRRVLRQGGVLHCDCHAKPGDSCLESLDHVVFFLFCATCHLVQASHSLHPLVLHPRIVPLSLLTAPVVPESGDLLPRALLRAPLALFVLPSQMLSAVPTPIASGFLLGCFFAV